MGAIQVRFAIISMSSSPRASPSWSHCTRACRRGLPTASAAARTSSTLYPLRAERVQPSRELREGPSGGRSVHRRLRPELLTALPIHPPIHRQKLHWERRPALPGRGPGKLYRVQRWRFRYSGPTAKCSLPFPSALSRSAPPATTPTLSFPTPKPAAAYPAAANRHLQRPPVSSPPPRIPISPPPRHSSSNCTIRPRWAFYADRTALSNTCRRDSRCGRSV